MIHQSIKTQLIEAMRAKDAVRLDVLRGLLSSFSNELIAKGSSEPFLDDASVMALIKKSVKQHKDSIDQFTKGNRMDLVEKEVAELKHLEAYLPAAMPKEEILKIATRLKETNSDKGKLIGMVMKECKGMADGNDVKAAVESLF